MVRGLSGVGERLLIQQRPCGGEGTNKPRKEHSKQWEQKIESFQDGEKMVWPSNKRQIGRKQVRQGPAPAHGEGVGLLLAKCTEKM